MNAISNEKLWNCVAHDVSDPKFERKDEKNPSKWIARHKQIMFLWHWGSDHGNLDKETQRDWDRPKNRESMKKNDAECKMKAEIAQWSDML